MAFRNGVSTTQHVQQDHFVFALVCGVREPTGTLRTHFVDITLTVTRQSGSINSVVRMNVATQCAHHRHLYRDADTISNATCARRNLKLDFFFLYHRCLLKQKTPRWQHCEHVLQHGHLQRQREKGVDPQHQFFMDCLCRGFDQRRQAHALPS